MTFTIHISVLRRQQGSVMTMSFDHLYNRSHKTSQSSFCFKPVIADIAIGYLGGPWVKNIQ